MRTLLLLLLLTTAGCTTWTITPDGCEGKSIRRVAVTCGNSTIISGQILINDSTVQVLARGILDDKQD
jgi:hypothetical protein